MKKRLSSQEAPSGAAARQTAPGVAACPAASGAAARGKAPDGAAAQGSEPSTKLVGASGAGPGPNTVRPDASTPQPPDGSAGREKTKKADAPEVVNDVLDLREGRRALVDRMLKEGSTFEDIVDRVNARDEQRITLGAVRTYFRANREVQTKRALRQVEDAEALLASLDKDPKSAEARLARATFLTGYSRVNLNTPEVTAKEAARYRLQCDNLNLKHQILMLQKKKAKQDLEYSEARTNLIKITQGKMQGDILRLERELRAHRAGDPIGPEVLQRIQQLYGLACQPLLEEVNVSVPAKA
jgi:hypothetical protein